jgi:hypothetical protein
MKMTTSTNYRFAQLGLSTRLGSFEFRFNKTAEPHMSSILSKASGDEQPETVQAAVGHL